MKEDILKIGGEGGSVTLFKYNELYFFSTNEAALFDLLSEEDRKGINFSSNSKNFKNFDLALKSMMEKYNIFRLFPIFIHEDYKKEMLKKFNEFELENDDNFRGGGEWKDILYSN